MRGVGLNGGTSVHRHLHGQARVAAALPVAARQHRAAAGGAIGVNAAGAGQHNAVSHQDNLAAIGAQAAGAQLAAVLDHRALQAGQRVGRQNDVAAFGHHCAAVFYQRGNGLRRGGDASQAGARAIEVQRDGLARGQSHGTSLCHDHALVTHFGREQGDVAAQGGVQLPVVDHAAGSTGAVEDGLARHEIIRIGSADGGHQTAHIHLRGRREINAVRVAQEHLPVGADLAVNLTGVVA